jgi:hypothetical protein
MVSASQIDLFFSKCPRKWGFAYIEGDREPDTDSTLLGTTVHKILQAYVERGLKIDGTTKEGAIAQAGLPWMPQPFTGKCEEHFQIDRGSVILHGYIDWNGGAVLDYKTTSDFKWAKTPETLATDTQALLYGAAKIEGDSIPLRWLYLRTKGKPASRAVDTSLSRTHLETALVGLTEKAETLATLKAMRIDPLLLPANPQACFAYQRLCHYAHKCNLTPLERIQQMTIPIGKDALLASLQQKALGAQSVTAPSTALPGLPGLPSVPPQTTAAPVILPPPPPVQVALPPATTPTIEQLQAMLAAAQAQAPATPAPPPVAPPPVAPPPVAPPPVAQAPVAPPPPAPEAKRGPGRPPGSGKEKGPIRTLYVNCLPLGEKVSLANDLFQAAHAQIAAAGHAHYKTIDFGKGPGVFAACVEEAAKALKSADVYVDSRTAEGGDSLEILTSLADSVVRGI